MEKFKEGFTGKNFVADEPKFDFKKPTFKTSIVLPLCSEVESGRTYLEKRKIDPKQFYFAEKFKEFANLHKQTFDDRVLEEPRIVIPLYRNKNLIGFQGRSLRKNSIKYITIMLDEDEPKIYLVPPSSGEALTRRWNTSEFHVLERKVFDVNSRICSIYFSRHTEPGRAQRFKPCA